MTIRKAVSLVTESLQQRLTEHADGGFNLVDVVAVDRLH